MEAALVPEVKVEAALEVRVEVALEVRMGVASVPGAA